MRSSVLRAVLTAGLVVGATAAVAQLTPRAPGPEVQPGAGLKAPAALPPISPADKARTAPAATRPPIDKVRAIVIPRENCGTWWSRWGDDPDANPCPANCERGERLATNESRDGGKVRYQVNHRCYLPELVVAQPPGALREAGAPERRNCGTHWTGRQSDPSTDTNPCPANCERGELLGVKRGSADGKSFYEMWYRCYVAELGTRAIAQPKGEPARGIKEHPPDAFHPKVIVTESMQVTGTRRPPFAPKVITTDAMQLTGMRRPPFAPKVITTDAMQLTGMRRPPFSPKIITAPSMELTGTRLRRLPINTDKPIEPAAGGAEPVKPPGK